MDVFTVIKNRHDAARQVVQAILSTNDSEADTRKGKFGMLYTELVAHHVTEETTVVPVLNVTEGMEEMGKDILEDHQEIRAILEDLKTMNVSDGSWMMKFKEMVEKLESHMKEEEGEISVEAHNRFNESQLSQLGEEFLKVEKEEKEKLRAAL